MRQYTTPSLKITLKHKDGTLATDIVFDYLIFSVRNKCYKIDKQVLYEDVVEAQFNVSFTQEETAKFRLDDQIEMEVNFFLNKKRFATDIKGMMVDRNLLMEVISDE